jgi:hypothetical protein
VEQGHADKISSDSTDVLVSLGDAEALLLGRPVALNGRMACAQVWIGVARCMDADPCPNHHIQSRPQFQVLTTKPPIWAVLWPSVPLEHFSGGTPCSNNRWFTVRVAGLSKHHSATAD